jgi:hypothetical protein
MPWGWCILLMLKVSYLVVRSLALEEEASGFAFVLGGMAQNFMGARVPIRHHCNNRSGVKEFAFYGQGYRLSHSTRFAQSS